MKNTDLLDELKVEMKRRGFRKTRTPWRKDSGDVIAVFNVQTSQWDSADYYLNLGVYLKCLGDDLAPPEYKCHVRTRLQPEDMATADIVDRAMSWFDARATLSEVRALAEDDSLCGLVSNALLELPET